MRYESDPEFPDLYALGRQALKRYILARSYGQSEAAAISDLISTFQEFINRSPLPPVSRRFKLVGKKDR